MRKLKTKKDKRDSISIKQRDALYGYIFIMPWLVGFFIFTAFPFFYSIYLSLNNVTVSANGIKTQWVGFTNFINIITKDVNFPIALGDTVTSIVISAPVILVTSLLIALMLNGKFRGRSFFRGIYFLPVIIMSGPVMSELIGNQATKIVEPAKYVVYRFFSSLPSAVGTPVLYVFDNLVKILWFSGVQIIIFIAGIQKIDRAIYEAAAIDGASSWEIFWKIILPYVKPFALVNAIYTIVEMASFPNNMVNVLIKDKMLEIGKVYSYSAAMSWIYFIVELILLGIALLILSEKRRDRR